MLRFTHSVITAIFPGEPGLASCPLNSPSPVIPGLQKQTRQKYITSLVHVNIVTDYGSMYTSDKSVKITPNMKNMKVWMLVVTLLV